MLFLLSICRLQRLKAYTVLFRLFQRKQNRRSWSSLDLMVSGGLCTWQCFCIDIIHKHRAGHSRNRCEDPDRKNMSEWDLNISSAETLAADKLGCVSTIDSKGRHAWLYLMMMISATKLGIVDNFLNFLYFRCLPLFVVLPLLDVTLNE